MIDFLNLSRALISFGSKKHYKIRPIQRSIAILQRVNLSYLNLQGFWNRLYIQYFSDVIFHQQKNTLILNQTTSSIKKKKKIKVWRCAEFVKHSVILLNTCHSKKKITWSSFLQFSFGLILSFLLEMRDQYKEWFVCIIHFVNINFLLNLNYTLVLNHCYKRIYLVT